MLLTSVKILSQGQGTFVQRIPELHPHSELDQVGNFGKELNDGVLQGRAQELPRELICHPELFKTLEFNLGFSPQILFKGLCNLCVDSGLDNADNHVRSDGVGLEIQGSDSFV